VENLINEHANAVGDAEVARSWEFPTMPGVLVNRKDANPVLEFIKTVSAVMGLSRDLATEVQVLKRNLLELIGVREVCSTALLTETLCALC
jgi:DNA polymerase epsilon subunit 1